jgi:mitochondrial fission protein ELM1
MRVGEREFRVAPSPEIRSLAEAREALAGNRVWLVTDGKMGDRAPGLGLTERLGLEAESRVVAPRKLFAALMPWGPIDPREAPGVAGSPLAPPFPDLAIGVGRRAASYIRHLKSASGGRIFTVFLRDPRSGASTADFLWVPLHDRLRGANVMTTLTTPHRFSPERLAGAVAPWTPDDRPVLGLLMGGTSKDFRFSPDDEVRLIAQLRQVIGEGWRLAGTPSRRTPQSVTRALSTLCAETGGWFWNGEGENPYPALLARSDALLVTMESTNMLGEAVATGRPVLGFRLTGNSRKLDEFWRGLVAAGAARLFQGRPERYSYEPIDATGIIAVELARRFLAHEAGQGRN